jgi:hypothetical protein
VHSPSVRGA